MLQHGTGTPGAVSAVLPYASGVSFWVKATRVASTGRIQFWHAPDQEDEPITWTQSGTDTIVAAGTPVPNSTQDTIIGAYGSAGTGGPMNGRVRRFIIRNGIGGPVLYDVNESNAYGQAATRQFNCTTGQRVDVLQTAPWVVVADVGYQPALLPIVDPIPTVDQPAIICTSELLTSYSRDRIVNDVQVANQGGGAFGQVDQASQQKYGPRTYQRLDFVNTNSDPSYLTTRANDLMVGYTEAILRVNSVRFRPDADSMDWVLDAFLNESVRVRYEHPSGDWGFSVVSRIQGIEHSIEPDDWVVSLMLDQPISFRYWDSKTPTGWGWDEGVWDRNVWDELPGANWSTGARWSSGSMWKA